MSAFEPISNLATVIGSNADMETCEYIISGQTFERRAVKQ